MAPNARSVLSALKRMGELGEITSRHGSRSLLHHNVDELTGRYRTGAKRKRRQKRLSPCFISQITGSDASQSIASGITKTGVNVEMIDLRSAEPQEVQELISRCAGIVIGMPQLRLELPAQTIISTVLAAKEKQVVGIFESGGGDDEPVDPLLSKFRGLGLKVAFRQLAQTDAK